jgi:hypothetical protein
MSSLTPYRIIVRPETEKKHHQGGVALSRVIIMDHKMPGRSVSRYPGDKQQLPNINFCTDLYAEENITRQSSRRLRIP